MFYESVQYFVEFNETSTIQCKQLLYYKYIIDTNGCCEKSIWNI